MCSWCVVHVWLSWHVRVASAFGRAGGRVRAGGKPSPASPARPFRLHKGAFPRHYPQAGGRVRAGGKPSPASPACSPSVIDCRSLRSLQKPTQRALRFALHGKRAFREAHIPIPRYTSCPLLSLRSGTAVL